MGAPFFNNDEKRIYNRVVKVLDESKMFSEKSLLSDKHDVLKSLFKSISLYPPIMKSYKLGSSEYTVETLIKALCSGSENDRIFNIPSKAVLGKSYLIAKLNFFYMIYYLTFEAETVKEIRNEVLEIVNNIIFTLMAEEVFFDIIMDQNVKYSIRHKAGFFLINLWEYRLDYGVDKFAPILKEIWHAREAFSPAFGTLMGTMEFLQFISNASDLLSSFFDENDFSEIEQYALDEFLFGLSYEELVKIKRYMKRNDANVIDRNTIKSVLKKNKIYASTKNQGPREFYSFFIERRNNANYRKNFHKKGPRKTLEEHVMCFLLRD